MQGGADSVYFGVGKLNMRSKSANNFDLSDLVNIASFCNEHGIKSYLTVNTVIYNNELEEMHTLVRTAKESGVSAVIASDMAVINYANSIGMEVHISTQCNISNYEAVNYYSRFADVGALSNPTKVAASSTVRVAGVLAKKVLAAVFMPNELLPKSTVFKYIDNISVFE